MKRCHYIFFLLIALLAACNIIDEPKVNPPVEDTIVLPADSIVLPRDSVVLPPDSVVLPPDTVAVPPDTTILPPDTLSPEKPDQRRNPDYLYDLEALPEITIELTEQSWNQYLQNFDANPNNTVYVPAMWTMRKGQDVWRRENVGLRPRGNTSRVRPEGSMGQMHSDGNQFHHAHFGVCFTEYGGKRFFGSDRVILKWFHEDPSYAREVYCYDLFRRFGVWSAPRASYCRLWILIQGDSRPVYMGVYELLEGVRKGWLDDRTKTGYLPDDDGNLWKAAWGADLSDFNNVGTANMGVSTDEHQYVYSLKTNKSSGLAAAQKELYDFMEQMRPLPSGSAQLKEYLLEHVDIDLFLRMMAVNVAVGMWDDYWVNKNNYYFYFDSQHRFYFIPFDYDNTLGVSQWGMKDDAATADPLTWGSLEGDRLLCRKIFSIPEFKSQYRNYLLELVDSDELFGATGSAARIKKWQQMVKPYLQNDTGEDEIIQDRPASWSSTQQYRLLTGGMGENFFLTRKEAIEHYCKP